jgi:hypothetical protein
VNTKSVRVLRTILHGRSGDRSSASALDICKLHLSVIGERCVFASTAHIHKSQWYVLALVALECTYVDFGVGQGCRKADCEYLQHVTGHSHRSRVSILHDL